MAWSRTKLIKFLMDEGRGQRSKLRRASTEWLIQEAVAEGAEGLSCPQCKKVFTDDNYECDTGLCAECQNEVNNDKDAEVSCPNCNYEFIP